jgi:tetratricopeptide (TPR) repeat protein
LTNPDYALALSLAQRANELGQGKNLTHLGLVGEAYYRDQKYEKAIATVEQVIGMIDKDSPLDAQQLKHYQARLDEYKKQRDKNADASKSDTPKQ